VATEELDGVVAARGAATLRLPAALSTPGRAAGEVLTVTFGNGAFARAGWNFAEVVDQHLDTEPITASAARTETGYQVSVTARSYVRDVTLQIDRVDPLATVDDALVTLLPGELATFTVGTSQPLDQAALTSRPVLRCVNDVGR